MLSLLKKLYNDENGYVVSAELVLISTIVVLSLIVGLSEVSFAVNGELHDMAGAVSALNNDGTDNNGRYEQLNQPLRSGGARAEGDMVGQ